MRRNIQEALIAGGGIGILVWGERYFFQDSDLPEVLAATWIQGISTFLMAATMIWAYETGSEKLFQSLPVSWRKIILWLLSGIASAGVNYVWQLKTGGSVWESVVMFALSVSWIMMYEFEIIGKTKYLIAKKLWK